MPTSPVPPYETPPPSWNFSPPNRRRAFTITPEQNQGSLPAMQRNESRHMLPLPSRIFSHSSSRLDLRSEREANGDLNFSQRSSLRPGTSYTAVSSISTPDLTATALPAFPPPVLPAVPHRFGGPAPPHIETTSPRRLVKSPPRSPAKSAKGGTGGSWCRFKVKVKKAISFKRRNNGDWATSARSKPLNIGTPFNFKHVETHGITPLRSYIPPTAPVGSGVENLSGNAGAELVDDWVVGCEDGIVHSTSIGGAVAAAPPKVLDHQDNEGMAVEDDDDSAWEDCEATHLFNAYHDRE